MKFYCSQKFWWMTVNLEKKSLSSCCAARESPIDLTWLRSNPGRLFNTPELQKERQDMLNNIPVSSCKHICWGPEAQGATSRRLDKNSQHLTHTNVESTPEVLHLILGSDCNLTCTYCGKYYSTAWMRDIDQNGTYLGLPRDTLTYKDKIVLKLGQNVIKNSPQYLELLDEVSQYKNIKEVQIAGGEPFLYNGLEKLVGLMPGKTTIITGLGVDSNRLTRVLSMLPPDRVLLILSAENINQGYEFNRYGNSFDRFLKNLKIIEDMGFDHKFASVVSNITLFGFNDFLTHFSGKKIVTNLCADPTYLSPGVLDEASKQIINDTDYGEFNEFVKTAVNQPYTEPERKNLSIYLNEFARRRNLNLSIFPDTFVNWLNTTT